MNGLHFEAMARDRQAERERTFASWAISRSTRTSWPPSPAPLPPLPPSPRLRARLQRLQVLLVGAIA